MSRLREMAAQRIAAIDDGLHFVRTGQAVVSVKAGTNVGARMICDLRGVVERERAAVDVLLTLTPPARLMAAEAVACQFREDGFASRSS